MAVNRLQQRAVRTDSPDLNQGAGSTDSAAKLRHPPTGSLAFQIGVLSNLVSLPFHSLYGKREEISLPEWRVMQVLDTYPDISISAICHHTGMHKMQVSRAVQRGVRLKRVCWVPDPADGRRKLVTLTPSGQALCQRMYPDTTKRENMLVSALTQQQRAGLEKRLNMLINHLRSECE